MDSNPSGDVLSLFASFYTVLSSQQGTTAVRFYGSPKQSLPRYWTVIVIAPCVKDQFLPTYKRILVVP